MMDLKLGITAALLALGVGSAMNELANLRPVFRLQPGFVCLPAECVEVDGWLVLIVPSFPPDPLYLGKLLFEIVNDAPTVFTQARSPSNISEIAILAAIAVPRISLRP